MRKVFLLFMLFLAVINLLNSKPMVIKLRSNWQIQSSTKVNDGGEKISQPFYKVENWYKTDVPTTILNALVKNGVYKNIFYSTNFDKIPKEQFAKPWWFRTSFNINEKKEKDNFIFEFDGIIYRANIWLNGKLVKDSNEVFGAFRRYDFNVTEFIKKGENILAIEIIPPRPGDFNVGFVDWNPRPPDESMGLWREVRLKITEDVSLKNPFIKSEFDSNSYKIAKLTISVEATNNTNKELSAVIKGVIEKVEFSKKIMLAPKETKVITFDPSEFKQLIIKNPRLWWTYEFGKPELYKLNLMVLTNNSISDEMNTAFGIREVKDYVNEKGHRGYLLNGKKILIKGGGWTDDVLLDNNYDYIKNQILYVKHMNLNLIRLEGFWGSNEDIYNLCDEEGLLIMAGWSCQWEWENLVGKKTDNFGGVKEPDEIKLISQSWKDQIKWLRNHPSILVWAYGSDLLPRQELEIEYQKILKEDDPTRPFIASAKMHKSKITGSTAVKMLGPYDYVPPIYWWIDTANGGAYGFNTETGPGPQVPPLESIKKMIPEDSLWPVNSEWIYHTSRGKFKRMDVYDEAMDKRYGKPNSVEEYCKVAQVVNYEAIRGMFESFVGRRYVSTGVIQWMLNSAWPKLWWQLYDFYLMPNGAFYGTKKSCEPLHIMLDHKTNEVLVSNFTHLSYKNITARIKLFDIESKERFSKDVKINLNADEVKSLLILPEVEDLSVTYFVSLKLFDEKNNLISDNFYWLSKKKDELDFPKTTWWITPIKEYADLTQLHNLKQTNLNFKKTFYEKKDRVDFLIEIENPTDNIAFCIELAILKQKGGESILPIFLEDNYFSLLPKEKRIIKGYYFKKDSPNLKPVVKLSGWNVKELEK